jgi:hypothetical protein
MLLGTQVIARSSVDVPGPHGIEFLSGESSFVFWRTLLTAELHKQAPRLGQAVSLRIDVPTQLHRPLIKHCPSQAVWTMPLRQPAHCSGISLSHGLMKHYAVTIVYQQILHVSAGSAGNHPMKPALGPKIDEPPTVAPLKAVPANY